MKEKIDISEWPYDKNQVSVLHELEIKDQKIIVKYVSDFIEDLIKNTKMTERYIKLSPNSLLFSLIFFNYNDPYYFWKFIKSFPTSQLKDWALYEEQLIFLSTKNEYNFINESSNGGKLRPELGEYDFVNLINPLIEKIDEIRSEVLSKYEDIQDELKIHFDNIWDNIKHKVFELIRDKYFLLNNFLNTIDSTKFLQLLSPLRWNKNDLNFQFELSMLELKTSIEKELDSAKDNAVVYKKLKDIIIPKLKAVTTSYIDILNKHLVEKKSEVLVNSNLFIDWEKKNQGANIWQEVEYLPSISPSNCLVFKNLYKCYKNEINNIINFLKISAVIAYKINFINQNKDLDKIPVKITSKGAVRKLKVTAIEKQIYKLRDDYLSLIKSKIGKVIEEQEITKFRTTAEAYFNSYSMIIKSLQLDSTFKDESALNAHKNYYLYWDNFMKVISNLKIPKEILFPTSIIIKENDLISSSSNLNVQEKIKNIRKQLINNNEKNYNVLKKIPKQDKKSIINLEKIVESPILNDKLDKVQSNLLINSSWPVTIDYSQAGENPTPNLNEKKVKKEEINIDHLTINLKHKNRKKQNGIANTEKQEKPKKKSSKNFNRNSKVNNSKKNKRDSSKIVDDKYNQEQKKLIDEIITKYDQNIFKPTGKKSLEQKINIGNETYPQEKYTVGKIIPPKNPELELTRYVSTLKMVVLNRSTGIDKGGRPAIKLAERGNQTLVWAVTSTDSCLKDDAAILALNTETLFFIKNIVWVANTEITGSYLVNNIEQTINDEDLKVLWKLLVENKQQDNLNINNKKNVTNAYEVFINLITKSRNPMICSLIADFNNQENDILDNDIDSPMNEYYENWKINNVNQQALEIPSCSQASRAENIDKRKQLIKRQQENYQKQVLTKNSDDAKLLNMDQKCLPSER